MANDTLWSLREVAGAGGLPLAIAQGGQPDGPAIMFLHGIGRSFVDFEHQFRGLLADRFKLVSFDLRGHGNSGKPWDEQAYHEAGPWAEDIAAVIRATNAHRPIVVGWSYGGIAALDYVRVFGDGEISGLNFVGNAGTLAHGRMITGGFAPMDGLLSLDINENYAAYRDIVPNLMARAGDDAWLARWSAIGMSLPPYVRRILIKRSLDYRQTLASIRVPMLLSFGDQEPTYCEELHSAVSKVMPRAELSIFQDCGHSPFWEKPEQFDRELAQFADAAFSDMNTRSA